VVLLSEDEYEGMLGSAAARNSGLSLSLLRISARRNRIGRASVRRSRDESGLDACSHIDAASKAAHPHRVAGRRLAL
jgi:hypothetical protein